MLFYPQLMNLIQETKKPLSNNGKKKLKKDNLEVFSPTTLNLLVIDSK